VIKGDLCTVSSFLALCLVPFFLNFSPVVCFLLLVAGSLLLAFLPYKFRDKMKGRECLS
jgi:hypothetical protein